MIFIAKDDERSKKKTNEFFEIAWKNSWKWTDEKNDRQMIFVEKENAIVPNKPEDVERMKKFLSSNPPGMKNFVHLDGEKAGHWYVPSRVEYWNCDWLLY